MKLKPIPRSRAKTAWGLLQDVKRAILAEPKRANMGVYTDVVDPEEGGPACGTVGCFAGWISLLSGQGMVKSEGPAERLLGPMNYYLADGYHDVFNYGSGDKCGDTTPGTRAHAKAVVARINGFMRRNAKALKARRLPSLAKRREMAQ